MLGERGRAAPRGIKRRAAILDPIPGEKLVLSMYSAYRPSPDAAKAIRRYATRPLKPSTPLGTSLEASS